MLTATSTAGSGQSGATGTTAHRPLESKRGRTRNWVVLPSILLLTVCVAETACLNRKLSRSSAGKLLRQFNADTYDTECGTGFLESPQLKPHGLAALAQQLGASVCAYSVNVTGISFPTESISEVVYTETRTYDPVKIAELNSFVDGIYKRMAQLPVQAVAKEVRCSGLHSRCAQYRLVVVDPSSGLEVKVGSHSVLHEIAFFSRSPQEVQLCECGSAVFLESAQREALKRKLSVDEVWNNIPIGLVRHRGAEKHLVSTEKKTAIFQLFDDGWRVREVQR